MSALEKQFRRITSLLYDTTVPVETLEREVFPFLADDVKFTDPWQQASGREKYQRGAAGFHCMLSFDFAITQCSVAQSSGRAIVDGTMNLKQVERIYTYPLRTILVYEFTLEGDAPRIHHHEEMWSVADMIDAVPGVGRFYRTLFRPLFSQGFLAASDFCSKRR